MKLLGWVERGGRVLGEDEIRNFLKEGGEDLCTCGGEFYIEYGEIRARDKLGIMPGGCPPGTVMRNEEVVCRIEPETRNSDGLDGAITEAVRLRSGEGVVAFSGGVDSALVTALSGRPSVTVGIAGCHDIVHSAEVAKAAGLSSHTIYEIDPEEVESALRAVLEVIPGKNPTDASIATTLYFVARWAAENGHDRILAGQGADELFGGYARYLEPGDTADKLKKDFEGLAVQSVRDQAVASLHGTYVSCPYLDMRVVRASWEIPPEEMIVDGIRKYPFRKVAAAHIPGEAAFYSKKAMQYGSGVMKEIRRLARRRGYKNVGEYIETFV